MSVVNLVAAHSGLRYMLPSICETDVQDENLVKRIAAGIDHIGQTARVFQLSAWGAQNLNDFVLTFIVKKMPV